MLHYAHKRNDVLADRPTAVPDSKDVDIQLGRRLKLRRTLLGLTQEQVATACGLSYQQIHKYETGHSRVGAARLIQFSKVLDTPVGWFFDGFDGDTATPPDASAEALDKAMARLISLALQVKSRQRLRQLIEFAKLLAEADAEETARQDNDPA